MSESRLELMMEIIVLRRKIKAIRGPGVILPDFDDLDLTAYSANILRKILARLHFCYGQLLGD